MGRGVTDGQNGVTARWARVRQMVKKELPSDGRELKLKLSEAKPKGFET
jgi:hypothetical protein